MDFQLQIRLLLLSAVYETPMGTSTEMVLSTISHKGPTSRIMLSKTSVLDANKCTCTIPYKCQKQTYTYTQMQAHAGMQSQSTEGITIFSPSARLDKIKLFPFSDASCRCLMPAFQTTQGLLWATNNAADFKFVSKAVRQNTVALLIFSRRRPTQATYTGCS